MVVLKRGMGTNLIVWMQGQTPTVGRGVMGVGLMRDVTHPCHPWLCDQVPYSCKGDPSILSLTLPPSPLLPISLPLHSLNHHHVGRWLIRHGSPRVVHAGT